MNWILNLVPDSVVQKMVDSIVMKFVNKWIALGAAALVTHGLVTNQQAQVDATHLIEIISGSGLIIINHLITLALHRAQAPVVTADVKQ